MFGGIYRARGLISFLVAMFILARCAVAAGALLSGSAAFELADADATGLLAFECEAESEGEAESDEFVPAPIVETAPKALAKESAREIAQVRHTGPTFLPATPPPRLI